MRYLTYCVEAGVLTFMSLAACSHGHYGLAVLLVLALGVRIALAFAQEVV